MSKYTAPPYDALLSVNLEVDTEDVMFDGPTDTAPPDAAEFSIKSVSEMLAYSLFAPK